MAEASSFVGKEVTVQFEVTNIVAWKGTVVADDEKGITLRRPYRKGVRLERIPRDQIRGVFNEVEKGPRRSRKLGAKGSTAQEPEEAEDFDNDGLDDGLPDTEWDDE